MIGTKIIGWLLIFVVFIFLINSFVSCNSALDLKGYLFQTDRYDKTIRPVLNWTTLTKVNVHLQIIAILDFNDVEETIAMTVILELSWVDEFLTWNASEFGNLSHISVPQNDVWKPYIVLENAVMKMGEFGTPSLTVDIHHDGKVEWRPIEVIKTSCPVDVARFPFDTQRCGLTFETSGYEHDEMEIDVDNSDVELHEYKGTAGWIIKSAKFEKSAAHGRSKTEDNSEDGHTKDEHEEEASGDEGYEDAVHEEGHEEEGHGMDGHEEMHIVCWITLERKPMYYILNIFLPICLLTLLNLFVFLLPVESGEKVSFVVTIFLSLAVFLTIVSGEIPENSENISLLNAYVFTSTIMSTLTVIITIIEIRLHSYGSDKPIPNCLNFVRKIWGSSTQVDVILVNKRNSVNVDTVKNVASNHGNGSPSASWHRVVRSLDNFFFVLFLVFYTGFTVIWCIIALKS